MIHKKSRLFTLLILLGLLIQTFSTSGPAIAQKGVTATPDPTSVTIAGDLQSEAGCAGDWDPTCGSTQMIYDATDDVWQISFSLPAGSYNYKAALNESWDENYGLHAQFNGPNIPFTLADPGIVRFYYDHKSHWVTDHVSTVIATVPGSFQSELGCFGDWQPDCLRSWLQDIDGDGTYTFETTAIPAGSYEAKVTIDESWDENYGQGGIPNGADIPFTVSTAGDLILFSYNAASHLLTITGPSSGPGHDNNVEYDGLGHNSQDLVYRQPFGAVNPNTPVTLRFRTFANDVTDVTARVYNTASASQTLAPMSMVASGISCYDAALSDDLCDYYETVVTPTTPTTLYYRFIAVDGTATAYYADDNFKDGGWGTPTPNLIDNSYVVTVYSADFQPIEWMKNAVIYQIFPDRFMNGRLNNDAKGTEPRYSYPSNPLDQILKKTWNALPEGYCRGYVNPVTPCTEQPRGRDYFGGDLKGVDQQLGYLQSIGVNTIYFNPIFDAASNHAYDTQNYYAFDPFFGTQKDWENLEKHATQLGMKIVLDGVFNHVSSDSKYFDRYHHFAEVGACESVSSPYRSWFFFQPQAGGPCAGPSGPNTMTYSAWFGFDSLPVLDKNNQAVRDLFYATPNSVGKYWLNQGADAWRLDVMGDGSFPDVFWQQFRTSIKATNSQAPIIGELWKKDEILPKIHGDMADTTMNYRFRNAILGFFGKIDNKGFVDDGQSDQPPTLFARKLNSVREDYPDATYYTLMNIMDSHDTERVLWSLTPGDYNRESREFNAANLDKGKQKLKLASLVQFTIPGAPTVYYGDEVGMTGSDDPDDRRTFPWVGDAPGGDAALRQYYASLGQIRNTNPVLRNGEMRFLLTDDTNRTMAYSMKSGNQAAIVGINRNETSGQTLTIPLGNIPNGIVFRNAFDNTTATSAGGNLTVTLPALGGAIWIALAGQDMTPTAAPTGLATVAGNHSATLTWNSTPGASSYKVYRSLLSGGGFELLGTSNTPDYTDNTAENSTRYYYVVTALDTQGNESNWSTQASAVPFAPVGWAGHLWPPTLTITINALQTQTVYAQVWVDGVTNAPGQGAGVLAQFAYGATGSDPATWTWQPMTYNTDVGNNDEYKVGFTPEQTGSFEYLARFSTNLGGSWEYAYTDASERGALTVNPSSDVTPPAAPANLHVTGSSASSISLAWDANSEGDLYRYEVWRSATDGGPYSKLGNVPGGTTTYDDTTVTSNATYYYVVTAQDTSFNRSADSNQATGTAVPQTVAVTFHVTVPASTDDTGRTVNIAGSLPPPSPQWEPSANALTRVDATHWTITLNIVEGTQVEYKYALASWDYVEKGAACEELGNRPLTVPHTPSGTLDVNDTVVNWRNVAPCGN